MAGGAALAAYGAGGGIPDPTDLGVAYRRYVAPALSLEATDARGWAASLSALWSVLPGAAVWLRLAPAALKGVTGGARLPALPPGDRTGWTLEAGIVVREAGGGRP